MINRGYGNNEPEPFLSVTELLKCLQLQDTGFSKKKKCPVLGGNEKFFSRVHFQFLEIWFYCCRIGRFISTPENRHRISPDRKLYFITHMYV